MALSKVVYPRFGAPTASLHLRAAGQGRTSPDSTSYRPQLAGFTPQLFISLLMNKISPSIFNLARATASGRTALAIASLALGAITAQAELASGVNVLTNSGFEDVTISPWTAQGPATNSISTSTVQTGAQSVQVDHTDAGTNQGIQQVLSIDSADALQEYTISASINHNGQSQTIGYRVAVWEFGPSGAVFHDSDWVWVAAGTTGWQDYSLTTELSNADSNSLWAVVYCAPQGGQAGTIFVDDVSLVKTPPLPSNVNLLENPGFEEATTAPWFGETTTISISNTSQTGAKSLQVVFPGQDFVGIGQNLPIGPADRLEEFTATCSVNNDSHSEAIGYKIGIWENSPTSGWTFNESDYIFVGAGTSDWVDLSYTVTLTDPDATFVRARITIFPQGSPKAAGHFLVDDFVVSKGEIPLPLGVNLLTNSGFEEATIAPWAPEGGSATVSTSTTPQTGAQSGQVDFPASDNEGIRQDVSILSVDRLMEYTVSCSVNNDSHGEAIGYRIGVWEIGGTGGAVFHSSGFVWVPAGSTDWVDLSFTANLTDPTATSVRAVVFVAPQGDPKAAGHFLVDDWSLTKQIPVTSFPTVDPTNLIDNGGFTQSANEVDSNPTSLAGWYTVDGSLSDWGQETGGHNGFWGKFADLVRWTHYNEDPNNLASEIGTVNNPSLLADDAEFTLDGTDKLNTDFNPSEGLLNLNSAGSYRNGMMQTDILTGPTIIPGINYEFSVDATATVGNDHALATFTTALTLGADVTAGKNLGNALDGTLLQIPATNLPTGPGTLQTVQINGADLLAAQGSGTVNVLVQNLNTDPVPGFPDVDPSDVTGNHNVSQVRIYSVSLTVVPPFGDVNKDGVVDAADEALANSYLDGSIDGGDDAATRQDDHIANGRTPAEALALLNLSEFDIDGDGTFDAADVTLIPIVANAADPVSTSVVFNGGNEFEIVVEGLIPTIHYHLKRTADLTADYTTVNTVEATSSTETFTDPSPLAGKAFYKVTN